MAILFSGGDFIPLRGGEIDIAAELEWRDQTIEELRAQLAECQRWRYSLSAELRNIANANWRDWDEAVRSPHQFVHWAQARANYVLEKCKGDVNESTQ